MNKLILILSLLLVYATYSNAEENDPLMPDAQVGAPSADQNSDANSAQNVQSDPIDISGQFNVPTPAPKRVTEADREKVRRERLEKHNETLALKKIETMRLEQEKAIGKKIQKAFNQQMKAIDKVDSESDSES
ncbi:MAG: hypothetical protein WCG27_07350 [Pseudomonadota bacterium]